MRELSSLHVFYDDIKSVRMKYAEDYKHACTPCIGGGGSKIDEYQYAVPSRKIDRYKAIPSYRIDQTAHTHVFHLGHRRTNRNGNSR